MIKIACHDCGAFIGYTFNPGAPVIVCPYCGSTRTYAEFVTANKSKEPTVMTDDNTEEAVNHPSHYTQGGIECIDAMIAAFGKASVRDYCACNAFKYIWRYRYKDKYITDLRKAIWYLNKAIELYGEKPCSRS